MDRPTVLGDGVEHDGVTCERAKGERPTLAIGPASHANEQLFCTGDDVAGGREMKDPEGLHAQRSRDAFARTTNPAKSREKPRAERAMLSKRPHHYIVHSSRAIGSKARNPAREHIRRSPRERMQGKTRSRERSRRFRLHLDLC